MGFEDTYVDAWLYSDHQRYFFFQVGDVGVRSALFLLTVPSTVGAPLSNPALAQTLTLTSNSPRWARCCRHCQNEPQRSANSRTIRCFASPRER